MPKNNFKVLFVSAEAAPFAKVGGLADVAGALPQALKNLGVDIRIIMPLHISAKKILTEKKYKAKKIIHNFPVEYDGKIEKINIYETELNNNVETRHCLVPTDCNVPVYFIDHKMFTSAKDVYDNENKFLFFSKAVVDIVATAYDESKNSTREKIPPCPPLKKGGVTAPDIIHCNDNHTALIPVMLKIKKLPIKTILTIHNLMHQGKISCEDLKLLNISKESASSLKKDSENGDIDKMAQGILHADIINTVSPTYAKEILTKAYGEGLENILMMRKKDLYGIINGIDTDKLNPENDPLIPSNYSMKNLAGKERCKEELLKKYFGNISGYIFPVLQNCGAPAAPLSSSPKDEDLRLRSQSAKYDHRKTAPQPETSLRLGFRTMEPPNRPLAPNNPPLIGLISRLDSQKGIDLVISALPELFKNHPETRFILLGTGLPEYENQLKNLAKKYPENFKALIEFDIRTAQEIYAGSDMFLMPSKFEPCGLGQLTAMRYGAAPIVRKTGGLADTVINFRLQIADCRFGEANGFVFEEYSVSAMLKSIDEALNVFQNKKVWKQLMLNGMERNSSWDASAKEYLKLYKKLNVRAKSASLSA